MTVTLTPLDTRCQAGPLSLPPSQALDLLDSHFSPVWPRDRPAWLTPEMEEEVLSRPWEHPEIPWRMWDGSLVRVAEAP